MSKAEWQAYWAALKRKMDEEPCSDLAGLDLIRGEPLSGDKVFNHRHLQVYGKGEFLRNMFQRALSSDAERKVPIISLASDREPDLADEVYAVLADKASGSGYIYSPRFPRSGGRSSYSSSEFFKVGECNYVHLELDPKGKILDKRMLGIFERGLGERFDSRPSDSLWFEHPVIYIFCPEMFEPNCAIREYVERLEDRAVFRIFSENMKMFDSSRASFLYGPSLYPLKTYEKMRKQCYRYPDKKGLWGALNEFFTDGKNSEALKEAKVFAGNVPFEQTAFGRFKSAHKGREKFVWFYPAQQSLGKKPFETISSKIEIKPKASADKPKPPRLQIVEDLRPRNQVDS